MEEGGDAAPGGLWGWHGAGGAAIPALRRLPGCVRGRPAGGALGGDPQPAPAPGGVHLHQRPAPGAAGAPPGLYRQGQRCGAAAGPAGGGVAGFARPHCTGKSPRPLRGAVLRRGAQHPSPVAGLPGDVFAQGPELGLQLSGENRALREDNQSLRLQCDRLSRGRAGTETSRSKSPWGHHAR